MEVSSLSLFTKRLTFFTYFRTKKLNLGHFPLTLHVQKVTNTLISDLGIIRGTFFICVCTPGVNIAVILQVLTMKDD